VESSNKLDNWGIKANLLHYCNLKDSMQEADMEAKKWDTCAMAFAQICNLCRSHLEAAYASYQLTNFKNLGLQQIRDP
jgi:hypothetical protein